MSVKSPALPTPVGRLAPSPTGRLHLGHARTFLCAWWSVRARGGHVLMRLEDLDTPRASAKYGDAALRDLEWLGLDWDGTPSVQSAHLERFTDAVDRLFAAGHAYACVCTRGDLRTAQNAPHAGDREPRYPGTCRDRFASLAEAERASGRPAGVRLRVPPGSVVFRDAVAGEQRVDVSAEVGDFLIARRGGAPAYQLAVVVDDAAEGVTEVLRGDDLLSSTARQWHLHAALGLPPPSYAHVALVTDAAGERLAKHVDSLSLDELRGRGADPRAIVTWAAASLGLAVDGLASARDVTPHFRLSPRAGERVRVDDAVVRALAPAQSR
jgi:glutamyl-tRNA synthetase